jgi:hypothetical protein
VLAALTPKIEGCGEELDAQAVGNALYGLQGMSSDVREVKDVLAALAPKIEGCREELSSQAVSNALRGLRSMSSDVPEVQHVLAALAPKIEASREEVGEATVGAGGSTEDDVDDVLVSRRPIQKSVSKMETTPKASGKTTEHSSS